ncbi:VTT domain-containing protein [Algoriphagus boritolerans]|uniref:TVP38/TMEM64 family membrane protein n=1 Tax=Algoriphagus boritolerans DSM 17298 = JCM 18970 TaxID=1120964 RepID=A0A1H5ZRS9_9BACT|nr:VTT domain-containing protein [Algoriphagus boritolerans]SEG39198.1 SNARE associated Golgi protein [Algoriphagus boritolerans DSM 17298 = JCM 18970]
MTKKASIFKTIATYLRAHPKATLGWIWVLVMPGIGSLFLLANHGIPESFQLRQVQDHLVFTVATAFLLGFAFLPTTLTALATGFFFGWIGFPGFFLGYLLANVIGYTLGKVLNADFLPLLSMQRPDFNQQLERRLQRPESLIFFIRISPVVPFAISNFLFASLKIELKNVLIYGIPGMLPRTLLAFGTGLLASSFLDAKKAMNDPVQWIILGMLFFISFWGIYRNLKTSRT